MVIVVLIELINKQFEVVTDGTALLIYLLKNIKETTILQWIIQLYCI